MTGIRSPQGGAASGRAAHVNQGLLVICESMSLNCPAMHGVVAVVGLVTRSLVLREHVRSK